VIITHIHTRQGYGEMGKNSFSPIVFWLVLVVEKSKDLYLGLLAYHSTALQNGYSPSQLLHGTKITDCSTTASNPFHSQTTNTVRTQRNRQEIEAKPKEEL